MITQEKTLRITFFRGLISTRVVLADVRNEGTKNGTTVPKTGARVQKRNDGTKNRNEGSFAKTALLQNRDLVSSRFVFANTTASGKP